MSMPEDYFRGSQKEEIKKLLFDALARLRGAQLVSKLLDAVLRSGKLTDKKQVEKFSQDKANADLNIKIEMIQIDVVRSEGAALGLDFDDPVTWQTNWAAKENIGAEVAAPVIAGGTNEA